MNNYFENLDENLKRYFEILSPEIPEFLNEYIQTPEMKKQAGISCTCGLFYSKIFDCRFWYSSLDHSVAVALIIWNFTKNKKQTLAGLLHDISTPAFKHCIDFLNGDYEKQESTEDLTTHIIENSKEIMELLKRDNIKVEEVNDYHIYPIADNDTPKLSADRLEYTLSNGLGVQKRLWDLDTVQQVYENIEVQVNEDGIEELGFKSFDIAEKFVDTMIKLSLLYRSNEAKISMQFLVDIIKKMAEHDLITKKDLYVLSEKEIIEKIENCEIDNISKKFKLWRNSTKIGEGDEPMQGKYCIDLNVKIRYIVPLVRQENKFLRITEISDKVRKDIEEYLSYRTPKYAWLDFDF